MKSIDDDRTIRFVERAIRRGLRNELPQRMRSAEIFLTFSGEPQTQPTILPFFLLNLISRFCGTVTVGNSLASLQQCNSLFSVAKSVNPDIDVEVRATPRTAHALRVFIGTKPDKEKNALWADAKGWVGYCGWDSIRWSEYQSGDSNIFGQGVAACLTAAEVFKWLIKDLRSPSLRPFIFPAETSLSALTFTAGEKNSLNVKLPPKINLGDVTFVGCGAVGLAAIYSLSFLNGLEGTFELVDPDIVDSSNLNRYFGAIISDVGKAKVKVAEGLLKGNGRRITSYQAPYGTFKEQIGSRPLDTVIVTVDNIPTRREIQSDLPRVILNGATDDSILAVSRHDFLSNACLGCIYPVQVDPYAYERGISLATGIDFEEIKKVITNHLTFTEEQAVTISKKSNIYLETLRPLIGKTFSEVWGEKLCANLEIPGAGENNDIPAATISFVSALAGILLAAELVKGKTTPQFILQNYFQMDTFFGHNLNSLQKMKKNRNCSTFCYEASLRAAFLRIWRDANISPG